MLKRRCICVNYFLIYHEIIFQAVIERQIIEAKEKAAKSPEEKEVFYLEVAKMVVIVVSLVSV